jgi:probable HAF family extracellular repeat protein
MKRFSLLIFASLQRAGQISVAKAAIVLCALVLAAPATLLAGKPAPPPSYPYTLRQLNPPTGASSASAYGLNESGRIVGSAQFPNNESAGCIWENNGQMVILPGLPTTQPRNGFAYEISNSGLISGSCATSRENTIYNGNTHSTLWENISGTYQVRDCNELLSYDIGVHLYGNGRLSANGRFVAVGGKNRLTSEYAVVIAEIEYDESNRILGLEVLDVLPGVVLGSVSQDDSGVLRVVGCKPSQTGAFLWKSAGGSVEFNSSPDSDKVQATAVNIYGQVAAIRHSDGSVSSALVWNESDLWSLNAARNLGTLGGAAAAALGINDLGQVVGRATTGGRTAQDHAFVFQNNAVYDLNLLAPAGKLLLQYAFRINNAGQMLVGAQSSGGSLVDVLLTPVGQ